jgi:hypothetical protein
MTIDAHHRFVAEECDWGFTRFVDLRKLYTPDTANGKAKATIENDEVEITAFEFFGTTLSSQLQIFSASQLADNDLAMIRRKRPDMLV